MTFLLVVALIVAVGAQIRTARLADEFKTLSRQVKWLRTRIERSERYDEAEDAVRGTAAAAVAAEPEAGPESEPEAEPEAEPVDPAAPALGPLSDLVGAELRWRAPPGSPAPFKTAPSTPTPEPPSEEGPGADGAITQETVSEEPASEETQEIVRDWWLGKKPTPTELDQTDEAVAKSPITKKKVRKKAAVDLEARIGGTWLLRIGLGILAISLALFASSVVPDLPPWAKVVLAYAGALAFFGTGKFFEAKLEKFARPVMAGGLAFGFFVAYAAYFVPAMQAVSLPVSIVWMVASMIAVLVAAERWQSQPTAGLAILLGQISAYVSGGDADTYSLVMIGLLALTAVILLLRHRWVTLGVLAVAASYGSHLLWIFAERDPIPGDQGFWINLAFLTSYYVVFLIADVLWWRRNHEDQGESLTPAQVRSARQLGPTNLVLYVSVTTFVFVVSGAGLETIEWFFLTLGVVQGALAWFYWDVNHRDFVFYPAFGTVLWTLGLFATLDALALNLVLASQALLLLIAAHRTRLWIFHGLAQAAMFVAFIHYLAYPSPSPVTLAFFLGGLGVASVYLLKASLEEIWYGDGSPEEWFGGEGTDDIDKGLAGAFTRFFARVAPRLAPLHGLLGGFVLVREAVRYLDPDISMVLFLSTVQLLLVATVLVRSRVALLYAVSVIAVSVLFLVWLIPGALATLLLLGGLATSALILVHFTAGRFSDSEARDAARHAYFVVAFVLVGALMALFASPVEFPGHLPWLVLPVLLLVFLERAGVAVQPMMAEAPREAKASYGAVTTLMCLLVSALVIALTARAVGTVIAAPIWVAGWATVILMAAGIRTSRSLFVAGYAVLLAGYYYFLVVRPEAFGEGLFFFVWSGLFVPSDLTAQVLSAWWAGLIITVVPLALALAIDRGIHDRDRPDEEPAGGSVLVAYVTYAVGFLLLGAFSAHQLPAGWSLLVPAVMGLALVWRSESFRMPRSVPAVVVGVALLHGYFLTRAAGGLDAGDLLLPLALLVTVTFALERMVARWVTDERDYRLRRAGQMVLVGVAAVTAMVAIDGSSLFGAAWATAAWSILAGAMLRAGFGFKSADYQRVALVVLGSSLLRLTSSGLAVEVLSSWVVGSIVVGVPLVMALAIDRRIHRGGYAEDDPFLNAGLVAYAIYGLGFFLLAVFANVQLPFGWSLPAPALVGLALVLGSERLGTPRSLPAVVVGILALHLLFLTLAWQGAELAELLWPLVLLAAATLGAERALAKRASEEVNASIKRVVQAVLVVIATITTMVAVYGSSTFGAAWTTAGWSIVAAVMMTLGFAVKSSIHRRVALIVVATCVFRVFLFDTIGISDTARTGAFFVLGLSLVGIAWLYTRYAEQLKNWL